jgi:5'-nucleotidase
MKKLSLIPMLVVVLLLLSCASQQREGEEQAWVSVTFYHTSDIHENSKHLPRIARFVESRKKDDPNVLFVDSGDWFNKGDLTKLRTRGEAIVAILSACNYDAMIPGNHDYSFGTLRLAELIDGFSLPVVAANCIWPEDIKPEYAVPYRIFKLEGVTVAVVGTATPISIQQVDSLLEIMPIEESISNVVAELEESTDIIVLLTHVGVWRDTQLAESLPGVDIIFGGHDHMRFRELKIADGTDIVIQHSGWAGEYIGELTVTWDGKEIVDRKLRLMDVTDDLPESTAVAKVCEKYLSEATATAPVSSQ